MGNVCVQLYAVHAIKCNTSFSSNRKLRGKKRRGGKKKRAKCVLHMEYSHRSGATMMANSKRARCQSEQKLKLAKYVNRWRRPRAKRRTQIFRILALFAECVCVCVVICSFISYYSTQHRVCLCACVYTKHSSASLQHFTFSLSLRLLRFDSFIYYSSFHSNSTQNAALGEFLSIKQRNQEPKPKREWRRKEKSTQPKLETRKKKNVQQSNLLINRMVCVVCSPGFIIIVTRCPIPLILRLIFGRFVRIIMMCCVCVCAWRARTRDVWEHAARTKCCIPMDKTPHHDHEQYQ